MSIETAPVAPPEVKKEGLFSKKNRKVLRDPLDDGPFDVVLLRNVLMYFDDVMKRRVLRLVAETLVPGGYLVVGDADEAPARSRADASRQ